MAHNAFTPTFNVSAGSVTGSSIASDTIEESNLAAGATLQLGTEQASTSGTAIDFTGIPAGTKQIIASFEGVSDNGTTALLLQLGDSGGFETTGHQGAYAVITNAASPATAVMSAGTGFVLQGATNASVTRYGQIILVLKDPDNNTWAAQWVSGREDAAIVLVGAATKSLTGVLDRVRFTTSSGNTFDAGSVNIAYK